MHGLSSIFRPDSKNSNAKFNLISDLLEFFRKIVLKFSPQVKRKYTDIFIQNVKKDYRISWNLNNFCNCIKEKLARQVYRNILILLIVKRINLRHNLSNLYTQFVFIC